MLMPVFATHLSMQAMKKPKKERFALVTMDLVGIERGLAAAVCKQIQAKHGIPRANVILSVSHTHTGPVIRKNLNVMYELSERHQKLINDYSEALEKNLVAAVGMAIKKLAPAKISWGTGQATFAVNRRNNKEADVPKIRAAGKLKGPIDHDVPVLAVRDEKGKLKAVAFGYACHATVLSFYQWSGDYPGFAQIELEKAHPGTIALFWAGCGGDQNPLPRRKVSLAKKYGKELATAVDKVLKSSTMKPVTGDVTAQYQEIDLKYGQLPTREKLVQDSTSTNRYVANRAKLLLEQLKTNKTLRGAYPYPVQTWRVGKDLTWVVLGGEVVVDYSLRFKKELGPKTTWVMGYANDVMAYVPSLRVLKEGGYEGARAMIYYGLPTVWSTQVEEHIVKTVHQQVKQLSGKATQQK